MRLKESVDNLYFISVRHRFLGEGEVILLKSLEKLETDSVLSLIPNIYYQFYINSQTYDKLINSGVTELTNYNEVFNLINVFYTRHKNIFESVRDWDVEETLKDNDIIYSSSSFEITSVNNDEFSDQFFFVQNPQQRHEELTKLLLSVKTRNRLRASLYRKKRLAFTFGETIVEAKKIINTIDNELND